MQTLVQAWRGSGTPPSKVTVEFVRCAPQSIAVCITSHPGRRHLYIEAGALASDPVRALEEAARLADPRFDYHPMALNASDFDI